MHFIIKLFHLGVATLNKLTFKPSFKPLKVVVPMTQKTKTLQTTLKPTLNLLFKPETHT